MGGFAVNDYYVQTKDHRLIDGATGCSNQVNFSTAASQRLVVDSLTHWAERMGVDGFRFDLAPVLGRTPNAFEREHWEEQKRFFPPHPLLAQIIDLAEQHELEMIAEAWDLWGYEVGNFPAGWGEWNGRYRDAVRRFLKGDGNTDDFIERVNGDYANFNDQGGPQKSINFVTAHDGFTLMDLVSFTTKHNDQAYPFGPSDGGSDDNLAWDSGGDHALRRARFRAFWTVLMFSRGVPMIVSGDEYGRTQNGNNNPWSLDTVGIWNNWAQAVSPTPTAEPVDPDNPGYAYFDVIGATPGPGNPLLSFTRSLMALRHAHPSLRQREYGNHVLDDDDVSYLFSRPDGSHCHAGDRAVAVHIDGSGCGDTDFLLLVNAGATDADFRLDPGVDWLRIVDTAAWAESFGNLWSPDTADALHDHYAVAPWSVAVLQQR
ncbi:alpha-amylase family protein [Enemella dayhoffiae]|uniref:hypothetical protein n=1 Tax=Enemella dayhoffiae TaxID=2016507 RepID=UPI0011402C74|nr:hypothetical protein [Enemella dayhoffiae]